MRIPGLKRVRNGLRQFRSRMLGGGLILGYHRISAQGADPFSLAVSPQNFAEQLTVLRDLAPPVSLPTLVQDLHAGTVARRTVALTLDDGYADNLYTAQPLLEKQAIPATIFVISGYLGQEFWWDELARLVYTEGAFADGVCLTLGERPFEWQLKAGESVPKMQAQLLDALYWLFRPLQPAERQPALEQLRSQMRLVHTDGPQQRALTPAELSQLAGRPLIEIGAHTHTHPALADLSPAQQQAEIERSRVDLADITGRAITGFSFPNGSYSATTQKLVEKAGYAYACSSDLDTARSSDQSYRLPRLWVPNLGGEAFGRWLRRWLA